MEIIGQSSLWSFDGESQKIRKITNYPMRKTVGHQVASYLDLATKVAELQFMNPDYVLLFRGQRCDYQSTKRNTSLKPSLFRPTATNQTPGPEVLTRRFEILKDAEQALIRHYSQEGFPGLDRMKKHRILRWSLLQHYEICKTPLLDVTHSLRIAASFASIEAADKAFIFVLGVPNLSGAVTASAESGLQIIRLASVCPPKALRPHIQEGYLLGEYPDMGDFSQKENYLHYEIDFGRRLIAKFFFDPRVFWSEETFPMVPEQDLYSRLSDPFFDLAQNVKNAIDTTEN